MQIWKDQVQKGIVELCVMATLQQGETYGYEIFQRSGGSDWISLSEATVYTTLRRLDREGLATGRVVHSSSGPARTYYRLTPRGRKRLREMRAHWCRIAARVDRLLKAPRKGRGT